MNQFLWGASATASLAIAGLFLKFWSQTRDRLFAMFSGAFGALAANWAILGMLDPQNEARHAAYIVRLVGFGLIVTAVIDKNRRSKAAR